MGYRYTQPQVFVDHQAQKRSGHMGHAFARTKDGKILSFYSNCDYDRVHGHSGYGWMEYKVSADFGLSWGEKRILPYSMEVFKQGEHTALCEKALSTQDGDIICLFQITDASKPISCLPFGKPTFIVSSDGGESWSQAGIACEREGRIYDAKTYEAHSQFLIHRNDDFIGSKPEHDFTLYEWSAPDKAFYLKSTLPGNSIGKGYCCMEYDAEGTLYAYTYDSLDEFRMQRFVSVDFGKSWEDGGIGYFDKKIRNPQLVCTSEGWFLHGRNGDKGDGLVIYHSDDGINWDKGEMVITRPGPGVGYYSNNIYIPEANRVLIQFSHVYDLNRVNIMHMTIENV